MAVKQNVLRMAINRANFVCHCGNGCTKSEMSEKCEIEFDNVIDYHYDILMEEFYSL